MEIGTMWWIVLVIFATALVVSVITFLLQWGGCCVQHRGHSGTHLQVGFGYAFDRHPGRRLLDEARRHRLETRQQALAAQPRGLPVPALTRMPSFTFTNTDKLTSDAVDCTICHEDMCQERVSSLPCGHMFHKKCIKTWLKRRATCPTCRLAITPKMLEAEAMKSDKAEEAVLHDLEAGTHDPVVEATPGVEADGNAEMSHNPCVGESVGDRGQISQLDPPAVQSFTGMPKVPVHVTVQSLQQNAQVTTRHHTL